MSARLSDLREPPVVGRTYLVPCVEYTYMNRRDTWPVIGQRHSDREYIGFDPLHYHIDPRFLTGAQAAHLRRQGHGGSVKSTAAVYPVARHGDPAPQIAKLVPRRCRIKTWAYSPPMTPPWLDKLGAAFGNPAEPIVAGDGRMLCPHQKADLSQFVPDENGIVVCPLHGLRVKCAASVDTDPKGGDAKQAPCGSIGSAVGSAADETPDRRRARALVRKIRRNHPGTSGE